MARDKQLCGVDIGKVLEKRERDQALNAKEFSVLAGISYSKAREWFRLPGFPVIQGFVFWGDFVEWRHSQTGLQKSSTQLTSTEAQEKREPTPKSNNVYLSSRAMKILSEAS